MRFKYRVYYALPWEEHSEGFKFINARSKEEAINKFEKKYPYYIPVCAI